jgi:hypothetical protein
MATLIAQWSTGFAVHPKPRADFLLPCFAKLAGYIDQSVQQAYGREEPVRTWGRHLSMTAGGTGSNLNT